MSAESFLADIRTSLQERARLATLALIHARTEVEKLRDEIKAITDSFSGPVFAAEVGMVLGTYLELEEVLKANPVVAVPIVEPEIDIPVDEQEESVPVGTEPEE